MEGDGKWEEPKGVVDSHRTALCEDKKEGSLFA